MTQRFITFLTCVNCNYANLQSIVHLTWEDKLMGTCEFDLHAWLVSSLRDVRIIYTLTEMCPHPGRTPSQLRALRFRAEQCGEHGMRGAPPLLTRSGPQRYANQEKVIDINLRTYSQEINSKAKNPRIWFQINESKVNNT